MNLFQQVSWKTKESVGHGCIGFEILKNNWWKVSVDLSLCETQLDVASGLSDKEVSQEASTRTTLRDDAATFDMNKRICFILMLRTWFQAEEFRLGKPPYLWHLFGTSYFSLLDQKIPYIETSSQGKFSLEICARLLLMLLQDFSLVPDPTEDIKYFYRRVQYIIRIASNQIMLYIKGKLLIQKNSFNHDYFVYLT